ncbi:MAG: ImmA/IrrE family metallo-endopeptidase [Chloroflexi bacterium]|nr:ImmA/IrrE family metallo-endopeptidase [Chloroflexota bacterium]
MNGQVQRVKEGALELMRSDRWQEWLKVQARFRRYSFYNTMLILMQRPEATRVAGYRTWQSLGRQVRRGEQGIRILAPVPFRKVRDDGEEIGGIWFKTVCVFDVAQTDGAPLPEVIQLLQGDDHLAHYARLLAVAQGQGYRLREVERMEANGATNRDGAILIKAGLSPNQKVKTLAHELAHQALGHPQEEDGDRAVQELEAESVAYILSEQLGLDSSGYSFGYLAHWSEDPQVLADVLTASGTRIARCARALLDQLDGEGAPEAASLPPLALPVP